MPNALAAESSPYLQQHADNPVDWLPWGDDALSLAAERDLPVLLSIGYSSCHWCHVMAHESFEDPEVAAYMNEHFVNIKVDREERPDIDAVYMEVAQAISGHGGWPLTVFLTPQQIPFYAGTYFPPEPRPEMPSFMQLLESLVTAWTTQRDQIDQRSSALIESLQSVAGLPAAAEALDAATLTNAVEGLHRGYDEQFGGFGGAPKFPSHSVLEFLLGRPDPADREPALESLRKMAAGGIHDQVGGGFARYSVDRRWHIPHFEKMLYDNALLARAFLHASQVATDEADAAEFRRVCRGILDWMLREMTGGDDGFASALDADSIDATGHLEEGAFYAWEIDELREVVEAAAPGHVGDIFLYWGVIDHGEFEGRNVLFVNAPERRPDDAVLEEVRRALYQRRETRQRPGRDDKRLTSWNALALAALAEAGAVLDEPKYSLAAVACADFIERELALDGGRLRRSSTEGAPGGAGFLEDHAYLIAAYLTLYEHGGDERWFVRAREIADATLEHFEDREGGGFFTVADDQQQLIVRRKDIEDNPIPSGNSAIALALLRLGALTGEARFADAAARSLEGVQRIAGRLPVGFGHALQAIDFSIGPVREIALVGDDAPRRQLRDALLKDFRPRTVIAEAAKAAGTAVPLIENRDPASGAAAYVCENFACELPVATAKDLLYLLDPDPQKPAISD